jgi:hypothetical protein
VKTVLSKLGDYKYTRGEDSEAIYLEPYVLDSGVIYDG